MGTETKTGSDDYSSMRIGRTNDRYPVADRILRDDISKVVLCDSMGTDLSVVRAARVSYNADWRKPTEDGNKQDVKLIRYLCQHRHDTPFESVVFTFEVTSPIFVFRQWHRHRTQSYNEVSARYTTLDMGYYVPRPEVIGTQAMSSKQARDIREISENELLHHQFTRKSIKDTYEACQRVYSSLLDRGVPRELARTVLPVNTYSRMFCTMNMLNLWKFLKLRLHPHAQWEIRQYAVALYHLSRACAPVSFDAFREFWLEDAERESLPLS